MSEDSFTGLMASVDPTLIVVTTAAEGERAGCVVGFHAQSSISAPQYSFWLSKANHTYRVSLRSTVFAIHFLTDGDLPLAKRFGTLSGEDADKFSGLDLDTDDSGIPLIRSCAHRLVVERLTMLDDGGDHVCVTARVRSVRTTGAFTPLRLSDAGHLSAGRGSDERVIRP